jgi:hypothetical protein
MYLLKIGTGDFFPLSSFAGCGEKIFGVEYQDCYFATHQVDPQLTQWVNETISGTNPLRDLVVVELNPLTFDEVTRLNIHNAFLDDFAVADLDPSDKGLGTFTFQAVPEHLASDTPQSSSSGIAKTWANASFSVLITNVDGSRVAAVRGIHMSAAKIAGTPIGVRREFVQGPPQFSPIRVEATQAGQTFLDIQSWVDRIVQGLTDMRNGDITLQTSTGVTRATLQFVNLVPIGLDAFPTGVPGGAAEQVFRRGVTLAVGSFTIQ